MRSRSKFEASIANLMQGHRSLSEHERELLSRFSEVRYLTKTAASTGMNLQIASKTIAVLYHAGFLSLRYHGPRNPSDYAITPAGRQALATSKGGGDG